MIMLIFLLDLTYYVHNHRKNIGNINRYYIRETCIMRTIIYYLYKDVISIMFILLNKIIYRPIKYLNSGYG